MITLVPGYVSLADWRAIHGGASLRLDPASAPRIAASAEAIARILARPEPVYGINTGFGKLASVRIDDADLATLQRIKDGVAHVAGGAHPMESKKALAREMVARFHGSVLAEQAAADFVLQFKQKEVPDDIPQVRLTYSAPVWICRLLTDAGLTASNGEAKRLIQQGGVKLAGEKVDNPDQEVLPQGELVMQAGKRKFARILFG